MMTIRKLLGLVACSALLIGYLNVSAASVGDRYSGLPYNETDCSPGHGFSLPERNGARYLLDMAECNGRALAWLSVVERRSTADQPGSYQVLDQLALGTLKAGERFYMPLCSTRGSNNALRWVAIYRWKPGKKNTYANGGIVQAWVINEKTNRFELAEPALLKRVVCEEEVFD